MLKGVPAIVSPELLKVLCEMGHMEVVPGDNAQTPIWDDYEAIVARHDRRGGGAIGHIGRFAFYEATPSLRRGHAAKGRDSPGGVGERVGALIPHFYYIYYIKEDFYE